MPKVTSKSAKSSAKLHHTPPFSKEYTKYVDIDLSRRKGRKWNNIFSLLLLLLVIGSIGTLIFSLINNTNNNDNDKDDI